MFRPCVSGLLAKHLDGRGCRQGVWNPNCAASILWSRQSAALPKEAPGECVISCVYAVRGCSDPVAGACCRSHLQNYHGIRCLGPIKAPRAGVKGRVVWASRFRGPDMATKECWGAPLHQLVHNPETGDATGSCSLAGRSFFFLNKWPGR